MHSSKQDLLATLQKISEQTILVVGDIILDRYIWGDVDRISPEAPVPVVDVKRIEERLGGAGNVARNLRSIGATVRLCALVGDDSEAKIVFSLLEKEGIGREGVVIDQSRPSTLKTRIMSQRQQIVRIDRESRASQSDVLRESFGTLVEAHIEKSNAIIISDYGKGVISKEVMRKLHMAQEQRRIGLKSRPLMVDPHPKNYSIYGSITLAKPNRKEAESASGITITDRPSAFAAAHALLKRWNAEMIVLSLGEDGLLITSQGDKEGIFLDTMAQEVFDVSGAGDTVVAVFTAALATGASPALAGDLANIAAGVVVSEIGTVPVNLVKLKREIERIASTPGGVTSPKR